MNIHVRTKYPIARPEREHGVGSFFQIVAADVGYWVVDVYGVKPHWSSKRFRRFRGFGA